MKSIISFVAVAALSFVTSAIAQQESPSPATEEKASATVEETSAGTPAEKPSATPATEKSPSATAEKSASPAPSKSASPAAAMPAKKMSVEATLKDNENRWAAAIGKHDTAGAEAFIAPDFIAISSKGKIENRRAWLGDMKSDKDTYTSTKNEKLDVHRYGNGVAVVVGTYREKGTGKDGKAFDRTFRFSDTWMERGGRWQCIATQIMPVGQR